LYSAVMNLLATPRGRRTLFVLLYFSEGAPIGLIWWALPALLRQRGVETEWITTLSATLLLPWVLKFLVAPAVDGWLRRGGRIKPLIVLLQTLMALSLLPLIGAWPTLGLLFGCLLLHATVAATHDVAVDALALYHVPGEELKTLSAWMEGSKTVARALCAGGVVWAHALIGGAAFGLVIGLIALPLLVLVSAVREPGLSAAQRPPRLAWRALWHSVVGQAAFRWALLMALVGAAGFESIGALLGPLLVDFGAPTATIGSLYGVALPVALVLGSALGGLLSARANPTLVCRATLAAVALAAALAAYAVAQQALAWFIAAVGLAYLLGGALIAASYGLFFVIATRGAYWSTRFGLLMAATNLCDSAATALVGRLSVRIGPSAALCALAALALLAWLPLRRLGPWSDEQTTSKP
jgi:MFS transporter, PAT family, beta-lactamase induction signal transducer AmpG